ncbi:MAG: hypothetical protein QM770_05915 [Tepidisphaeraceae bacterium]
MPTELKDPPALQAVPTGRAPARALTIRAVLLGLLLMAGIAIAAPFNDHVVNNGYLIGNFAPPVLLAAIVLMSLGNSLVRAIAPKLALRSGERAVAAMIVLVGCSLPNQGLLRQLIPILASPFSMKTENPEFAAAFNKMDLPAQLFPVQSMQTGEREHVITDFYGRLSDGGTIPWSAWTRALLAWSIPVLGAAAMLIGIAYATSQQWLKNERLAFPLATLYEQLLADPEPGRRVPALLRSPMFWTAAIAALVYQSLIAAQPYYPRYFPNLYLYYDFKRFMTEPPLRDLPDYLKSTKIYLMMVGIAYFIPTRASFSVWSLTVIVGIFQASSTAGNRIGISNPALFDEHFGAAIALVISILWLGRTRYGRIVKLALLPGVRRNDDDRDITTAEVMGLRVTILGTAVLSGWLFMVAGLTWWVVLAIVGTTVLCHIVTARIVAEIGIPCVRSTPNSLSIVQLFPATAITTKDAFFAGVGNLLGSITSRESVTVYAQHADVVLSRETDTKSQKRWPAVLTFTLIFSAVVCTIASLMLYYSYSNTLETGSTTVENKVSLVDWPQSNFRDPVNSVSRGAWAPKAHDPVVHISAGFIVAALLAICSARFAGWPFVPIGFLLATGWYGQLAWLSLAIGWIAKTTVLRFGGASLFVKLRPIFVGLIVGEAMAVVLWLFISGSLALLGHEYYAVRILPQ